MSRLFEEVDYRVKPIGAQSLRRVLKLGADVFRFKPGDEFLMTSPFTASEAALARLGLSACRGAALDIMVAGLGLGPTAKTGLDNASVRDLVEVEFLEPVIEWHEAGVLPMGRTLAEARRCRLVQRDFFAMAVSEAGIDAGQPGWCFGAVLEDIDHMPELLPDVCSGSFFQPAGPREVRRYLKPGGNFGLWSNDPVDERVPDRLAKACPMPGPSP